MLNFEQILEKLWSKTVKDETTGCWLWTAGVNSQGYGYIYINYRQYRISRIYAWIHLGLFIENEEQVVCHKSACPNKHCWNPEHLYIGTQADNIRDARMKGMKSVNRFSHRTHCKWGHEYTKENTYIAPDNSRHCRQCDSKRQKEYYNKTKLG